MKLKASQVAPSGQVVTEYELSLSRRDVFASLALYALLSQGDVLHEVAVEHSVSIADDLILRLDGKKTRKK